MEIDELKQIFDERFSSFKDSIEKSIGELKSHIDDRVSGLEKRTDEKINGVNKLYDVKIRTLEQVTAIREENNEDKWKTHLDDHKESKKTTVGIVVSIVTLCIMTIGSLIKLIFFSKPD